jgi:cation/acetate symporter
MYGTYTGGFVAFIVLLGVLEYVGVPNKVIGYLFVFFTLAVYAVIGVMTRTTQLSEYYVAAEQCPPSSTAWRPAPTGCRRLPSSRWPA